MWLWKTENVININFDNADFKQQISKIDTLKTAYVYCSRRSGKASEIFTDVGFKKVIDLKGGYNPYSRR